VLEARVQLSSQMRLSAILQLVVRSHCRYRRWISGRARADEGEAASWCAKISSRGKAALPPGCRTAERVHARELGRARDGIDGRVMPVPRWRCRAHRAPTGAKGLNLAAADVRVLSRALASFYAGDEKPLSDYSATAAAPRVARRAFLLVDDFAPAPLPRRNAVPSSLAARRARLRVTSRAKAQTLAENYVGLPLA